MNIQEIAVGNVYPYENNPRLNDNAVDAVARSIEEFGFQQPLVLDKDHFIIVGHTRFKAAQKLGYETVPCVIADNMTEEQVTAYRLADNKVGELAKWDFALLQQELDEVISIDMGDFGFDMNPLDVDWANVEDLSEQAYDEPQKTMLQCPHCNHVDSKNHFLKVSD